LPVLEDMIRRARRFGQLRGENPYHRIRRSARYVALAMTTAGRTLVS
jgi:hypothetical protein